ncbi:MAG: Lrp/AsnC family transcriptional regulator [Candidatus Aminicenantes bacterium]|nr:Lrp/AsnC family transcriptional regulator [Candidatus Aminicenantes bacterium]
MLSELEKKILNSLNKNARKSFRQVAKEVGTSTTAVYNNVKKLEKKGILKGYFPDIDEEKVGYTQFAIIALRIDQRKLTEVESKLVKYPQIRAIYDITGDWDCILVCYFKSREELDNFLKEQLAIPHVERVITHIVLNVVKDDKKTHIS